MENSEDSILLDWRTAGLHQDTVEDTAGIQNIEDSWHRCLSPTVKTSFTGISGDKSSLYPNDTAKTKDDGF